jgi:hypothetical protein
LHWGIKSLVTYITGNREEGVQLIIVVGINIVSLDISVTRAVDLRGMR